MGFVSEYKAFVTRGNVLDLAVALVVGAAFGRVVQSFVSDVLMPPINLLLGGVRFTDRFVVLRGEADGLRLDEAREAGAIVFAWGAFVTIAIEFLIVGLAVFLIIRQMNRFKRKEEAEVTTRPCPRCLTKVPLAATRCPACTSEIPPA